MYQDNVTLFIIIIIIILSVLDMDSEALTFFFPTAIFANIFYFKLNYFLFNIILS